MIHLSFGEKGFFFSHEKVMIQIYFIAPVEDKVGVDLCMRLTHEIKSIHLAT